MLRGMALSIYHAEDLDAAARWYSDLVGTEPYYVTPYYVEFRLGDYQQELGIVRKAGATPAGVITYWHVDDIDASYKRLLALGASVHEEPREFGEGFVAGSVVDPFGNILGIMYNARYLEVVSRIPDFELPEIVPVVISEV
ncbi:MAG TPA: VOC family protein [Thermomicrobiales bacterium]|nr:VOC family protein [Thermomicrobiales bacterium]